MAGNAQGLAGWRQVHPGAVPIKLELQDGSEFVGKLESFEPDGELVVDTGEQDRRIPEDEVDGFTLLDPEPHRGDELRGEPW